MANMYDAPALGKNPNPTNEPVTDNPTGEFAWANGPRQAATGIRQYFVKVGGKLIPVKSGNHEEQIKELQEMGILTVPPKKKTEKPVRDIAPLPPDWKKRRHKILKRKKAKK